LLTFQQPLVLRTKPKPTKDDHESSVSGKTIVSDQSNRT